VVMTCRISRLSFCQYHLRICDIGYISSVGTSVNYNCDSASLVLSLLMDPVISVPLGVFHYPSRTKSVVVCVSPRCGMVSG
jgi:hypothetical protein